MPSLSKRVLGVAVLGVMAVPLLVGSIRTSGRVIVTTADVVEEDLYAFGGRVIVEGTIRGDLFVITGDLDVSGDVEGDIIGLVGGPARISGTVGGSVRVAAVEVEVTGQVADDVGVLAVEALAGGSVGRDVLAYVGELVTTGAIGRDVRGQALQMDIDGAVGRDVVVRVDRLDLGRSARIGGDVSYKAGDDADVDPAAEIAGQFTRRTVLAPVWAKAVTRVFGWLTLFGLIVSGVALAWSFRATSVRAARVPLERPWRAGIVGLVAVLAVPVAVLPLFLSLVGLPIGLILLVLWLLALFLGPLPTVTAVGSRLVRGRGGLMGGLVVGAIVLRGAMWALPLVAGLLYGAAVVVGLGSYLIAAWEARTAADTVAPAPS